MRSDTWVGLFLKDSMDRSAAQDPPLGPQPEAQFSITELRQMLDERRSMLRRQADVDREERNLTDADVTAIVTELKATFLKDFYSDLGKGAWAVLWRGLVAGLGLLAAYGQLKSWGVMK